jgi:hypothetical protein
MNYESNEEISIFVVCRFRNGCDVFREYPVAPVLFGKGSCLCRAKSKPPGLYVRKAGALLFAST